jgi:sugar (pentulose or hexulose) kinase
MHGYILANKSGNLLTPYVSWRDRRAAILFENGVYLEKAKNVEWSRRGTTCKENLPLYSLYTYKDICKQDIEFFTLGSYITYYMTGNNTTHITDCAASGFYDINSCIRNTEEFPNIQIPKAVAAVETVGKYKDIDVYAPVGDHQASFLGSNVKDSEYFLNIGTATQISTLSYELSDNYECRPYFDDRRLCTVSGLIGGRTIREVCKAHVNESFCTELAKDYLKALTALPQKKKLLVRGGAVRYFPDLIKLVCEKMEMTYDILNGVSAINGLKILVKEMINH